MKVKLVLKNIKTAYTDARYIKRTIRKSNSGMTNIIRHEEAWAYQKAYGNSSPSFFKIFRQELRDLMILGN